MIATIIFTVLLLASGLVLCEALYWCFFGDEDTFAREVVVGVVCLILVFVVALLALLQSQGWDLLVPPPPAAEEEQP